MGLIQRGILGGFRKKTGTVAGSFWRRQDVIRALPRKSGKPATQAQTDQKLKFALVIAFLRKIGVLIDVGFFMAGETVTPMNKAVAYHLKEAITGVSPNFSINLEKVIFSKGNVEFPSTIAVEVLSPNTLVFTWSNNEVENVDNHPSDLANFLVYNVNTNRFAKAVNIVSRSAGTYEFVLPPVFEGCKWAIYASFNSVVRKNARSESRYLGTIEPS